MTLDTLKLAAEGLVNAVNKPDGDPAAIRAYYEAVDPQTVLKLIKAVEALRAIRDNINEFSAVTDGEFMDAADRALQELGL